MFEIDDDFDLDAVMLDTVSIIEEEAIQASNLATTVNIENKNYITQHSAPNEEEVSTKCSIKRKSDTEADLSFKLPKRSSQDCLRLLETSAHQESEEISPHPLPDPSNIHSTVRDNKKPIPVAPKIQSPKPPTTWRMENKGTNNVCGMRTIPSACQRKFPGPAGLLPERVNRSSYTSDLNESGNPVSASQTEIPLLSQPTQSLDVGPWQALKYDLQEARDLLDKYTVSWVKHRVATRRLAGQKIPFLAAVLHNVDTSSSDPLIVLRDKTGVINGTVHRSVWERHGGQLVQGSALVLRLVGVACTGSATQQRLYVNVTSNNIVTIYSPSPDGDVEVTEVNPWDIVEMRDRVKEWEAKCKADAAAANSSAQTSALFSSVLTDRAPLRQIAPPSPGQPSAIPSSANNPPFNAPKRPATNINLQRTVPNNFRNQNANIGAGSVSTNSSSSTSSGNARSVVEKTSSNLSNSAQLPKPTISTHQTESKSAVTSTQNNAAEPISLEVSSFLDGLDTDLLFDDF